jgi:hypothetical protein
MSKFILKGKVRDQANKLARGYHILAYDDDPLSRDDFLGEVITDKNGLFLIEFDDTKFNGFLEFDGEPDVYLIIKNRQGAELVRTRIKKTRKEIEYQIRLVKNKPDANAPDIYSGNLQRIFSMLGDVGDMFNRENQINLAAINSQRLPQDIKNRFQQFAAGHQDRITNFQSFSAILDGIISSYLEELNIGRIGYDGPQVPSRPRREVYSQAIIWPRNA